MGICLHMEETNVPIYFQEEVWECPRQRYDWHLRGDSETWRDIPDAIAAQSEFDVNRIRLMVGEVIAEFWKQARG